MKRMVAEIAWQPVVITQNRRVYGEGGTGVGSEVGVGSGSGASICIGANISSGSSVIVTSGDGDGVTVGSTLGAGVAVGTGVGEGVAVGAGVGVSNVRPSVIMLLIEAMEAIAAAPAGRITVMFALT